MINDQDILRDKIKNIDNIREMVKRDNTLFNKTLDQEIDMNRLNNLYDIMLKDYTDGLNFLEPYLIELKGVLER